METISLVADKIGQIGPVPVTNTLLVSWIVSVFLIIISLIATRKVSLVPTPLQNFFEFIIDTGYAQVEDLSHDKAKVIFPLVMTFFLFIICANWIGLLPGFGTIGFRELKDGKEVFVPIFRSINADLNMTLALALVSAVATHVLAIKYLGIWDYLKRWVSLNPIFLFVGILEIISEFTKIISLSFRLFGNIFAGEVVLATVSSIFAFFVPLPFYFLELIVGFVQAAVFMMLTLVFIVLLTEKHGEEH
ncbi:F0F1 ATP synthase subunit A [Candidatus Daviesbacteria bacterium]|nr:F0F1 ATP synthase subunit A [Candidatus Daviesbacteria bacterium]